MTLDMKETVITIDSWFSQRHEEIIDKLRNQPKLQLEFLLILLKEKESVIESID
jgi:hypothetical protein